MFTLAMRSDGNHLPHLDRRWAAPTQLQSAIHLPMDDAINLEPGAGVKRYLNVAPLGTVSGVPTQSSYEATLTSETGWPVR
ncbi:hypothetical protein [Pseudomonas sp.]|uniref:hypothetical protein n=1 Tax=Pseudomonas sp. TaxID=306 RepID=UPI0028AEDB26|nr:hypothetical protein [Pseudomonas sp.]